MDKVGEKILAKYSKRINETLEEAGTHKLEPGSEKVACHICGDFAPCVVERLLMFTRALADSA